MSQGGTLVLIHGLWMTPLSWEHWVDRYAAAGLRVLAPAWPGADLPVERLRRDPSGVAGVGVAEIAEHYERIIRALRRPPVIIGHSFGGAVTQILLDRGLGAAGVAIDSAPVKGVLLLPPSTLRASYAALRNPANRRRPVSLTAAQFHYAFTNTLTRTQSDAVYRRYCVPGPARPVFQAAFANVAPHASTTVNFRNDERAPLLLIAGGRDHLVPAAVTRSNFRHYRHSQSVTDFVEYPARSHYTLGQDGWEAVADYALNWATSQIAARNRR